MNTISGLILLTACLALPWMGRAHMADYLTIGIGIGIDIGIGWLCLTLVFEFTFGRLVQGKPWPELLEAYRFTDGNLWPIVLLFTAAAPSVAARFRGWV